MRRSTDRQEQSIGDQKKAIEEYMKRHGMCAVRFYVDDAVSGSSTAGRRAFREMIRDAGARMGSFDSVVVYDVKRFGRVDNDEAGYYRYLLRSHGVEVHYVSENFHGDSTDDLVRPVKQWQARQESKDLSKVTIRGLVSKSTGGWWMGGVPPYGYDLRYEGGGSEFLFIVRHEADGTKKIFDEAGRMVRRLERGECLNISNRDRARLVPGESMRVKVVQRIFGMYLDEGKGYRAIADTLNREGVATARGPKWSNI
ncbi:MAG: recombinase family protein, partial [Planctomycetota bacterium]